MKLKPSISPRDAWEPITAGWNEESIRHLLRRASWTARPADVRNLSSGSPKEAMQYLFHRATYPQPHPVIEEYADHVTESLGSEVEEAMRWAQSNPKWQARAAKVKEPGYRDPHGRAIIIAHYNMQRSEARKKGDVATFGPLFRGRFGQEKYWNQYALEWLKIANTPTNSAFEKLNGFLQNVLVVNKTSLLGSADYLADTHNHHRVLRENFFKPYPEMCKRMSRTSAMGRMLDLIHSTKQRPNENFARELMELFTLGVDNGYDEDDIKESSKAWTGYVLDQETNPYTIAPGRDELILNENLHDTSRKRVFGRSRDYDGDDIVDLIFTKEEVETFVPKLLTHHFLVEGGLPTEYLEPLGKKWRDEDFNFGWLVETFFQSRIFYDPVFRGQIYKSPFQFYLGLLQDLGLQVEPSLEVIREMDYLGQSFANPADVNGWNGGAFWMNNGSINGRRIMVERLFTGTYRRGNKMTSAGASQFVVTDELLKMFIQSKDRSDFETVDHFITYFLAIRPTDSYTIPLREHYGKAEGLDQQVKALREILLTILQSQYYQVC